MSDYAKATTEELRQLLTVNAADTQAAVKITDAKKRKAQLAELRSIRNKIVRELGNR
jgi:hypothetical protein